MKRHQRKFVKDFFQIGNYIYADLYGRVQIVIPKGELVTKSKLKNDYQILIKQYGVDAAVNYLKYCSDYLNNSHR